FFSLRRGPRSAWGYLVRLTTAAAVCGSVFALRVGAGGLYFNMFAVPSAFALVSWHKFLNPEYLPFVVLYVLAPATVLAGAVLYTRRLDSLWLQPALVFCFSLPFTAIGFLNFGGTVNSLHAFVYL